MSLLSVTDLSQFLEDTSEIPTDVTFRIINEDGVLEAEVKAHKMHLAEVSPVFRRGFYGRDNNDKISGEVIIQETTKSAFQSLIALIYKNDSVSNTLRNLSFDDVFQVANLAERYQIQFLMEKIQTHFESLDIDTCNCNIEEALRSIQRFESYVHLQKVANALLLHCAKTIQLQNENRKDLLKNMKAFINKEVDPSIIMKLITTLADLPSLCCSCQSYPCKNARVVERYTVHKCENHPMVEMQTNKDGIITRIRCGVGISPACVSYNGEKTLVYSCKCLEHTCTKSCMHFSVL